MKLINYSKLLFIASLTLIFGATLAVFAADVTSTQAPEMSILDAIILGIVEGVTEYLPVSSTGHLILTQKAMGIGADSEKAQQAADAYAICIQAGAILAVLGIYVRHVKEMAQGVIGKHQEGRNMLINLIIAFIPAAVVGLLFDEKIEQYLFGLKPIIAAWFVGGVVILVVAHRRKSIDSKQGNPVNQLALKHAFMIGCIQCIAMWPGTSRSLVTILGGLLVGLSLSAAVEFSFLLGVVTLTAATAYKALQHGDTMLQIYGITPLLVGFIAATVSAVLAVKWMVDYLNKHGLAIFGYYRIVLAIVVAVLLMMNLISD